MGPRDREATRSQTSPALTDPLGEAMARALVDAGARVAVTGRDAGRTARAGARLGVAGVAMDVRDEASVDDDGGGRVVNISMNHSTMNRQGFVPYGPARPGPARRRCPGSWPRTWPAARSR